MGIGEWIAKEQTTVGDWIGITVLSGAILGGAGWLLRERMRKKESEREYQDQVSYLVAMVTEFRKHIPAEDITASAAVRRKALYDSFKLRFEEALEGRADRLSFEEKLQLRLPIETAEVYFQHPWFDEKIAKSQFEALRKLFKDFDRIDCLKEHSQEPGVLKRVWGCLWGSSSLI